MKKSKLSITVDRFCLFLVLCETTKITKCLRPFPGVWLLSTSWHLFLVSESTTCSLIQTMAMEIKSTSNWILLNLPAKSTQVESRVWTSDPRTSISLVFWNALMVFVFISQSLSQILTFVTFQSSKNKHFKVENRNLGSGWFDAGYENYGLWKCKWPRTNKSCKWKACLSWKICKL